MSEIRRIEASNEQLLQLAHLLKVPAHAHIYVIVKNFICLRNIEIVSMPIHNSQPSESLQALYVNRASIT